MSAEENKALAQRFLEAQVKGDLETLDELLAPDFVDRSLLPGQGSSREDYMQSVVEIFATFPNVSFSIEDQIAAGDKVVTRYTGRSVHRGDFMGAAATGEEADVSGIYIHRIADGKIAEEWMQEDFLGIYQQLTEGAGGGQ